MEFDLKNFVIGLTSMLAMCAANAADTGGIRGVVGLGLTFGGETIGKVVYENGDTSKLHSSGVADLRGGMEFQLPGQPVAIELSIGYHFDKVNARNGDASFTRFPLELIGHYALNEYWRLGLGLRKSLSTEFEESFGGTSQKFTSSVGPLIEVEYFMTPQFSFKGRYVVEDFKTDDRFQDKLKGSHGGIYGMFYF